MLFGYARVSTQDQNLNLQLDDLKKAGCQKIFQEKISSVKERPQLQKLLEILREGDTILVWKLDRLGRSLKELFTLINDFQCKGIGFRSLNDAIDTTTAQGRLVFNLFASLAEFDRTGDPARSDPGAYQSGFSRSTCPGTRRRASEGSDCRSPGEGTGG